MLDVPAPPVGYVGPAILGESLYNVNDLRNAPSKQGLEVAKWIIHKVSQSMISTELFMKMISTHQSNQEKENLESPAECGDTDNISIALVKYSRDW